MLKTDVYLEEQNLKKEKNLQAVWYTYPSIRFLERLTSLHWEKKLVCRMESILFRQVVAWKKKNLDPIHFFFFLSRKYIYLKKKKIKIEMIILVSATWSNKNSRHPFFFVSVAKVEHTLDRSPTNCRAHTLYLVVAGSNLGSIFCVLHVLSRVCVAFLQVLQLFPPTLQKLKTSTCPYQFKCSSAI